MSAAGVLLIGHDLEADWVDLTRWYGPLVASRAEQVLAPSTAPFAWDSDVAIDLRYLILRPHWNRRYRCSGYPRTHGLEALAEDVTEDHLVAACDPGSAIVFLGSTLHGAGANQTTATRRAIVVSYCLGWLKPYENQWLAYPPAVARTFAPDLAALVG